MGEVAVRDQRGWPELRDDASSVKVRANPPVEQMTRGSGPGQSLPDLGGTAEVVAKSIERDDQRAGCAVGPEPGVHGGVSMGVPGRTPESAP